MNKLQRRNQRELVGILRKPLLFKSIELSGARLLEVQTATWEQYWNGCDNASDHIESLRCKWHALIESGYSTEHRSSYVVAYFQLLRACLQGYFSKQLDVSVLKKVGRCPVRS